MGDVGGNSLGFYGGVFGPDGQSILAYGYQGAFQMWRQQDVGTIWPPLPYLRNWVTSKICANFVKYRPLLMNLFFNVRHVNTGCTSISCLFLLIIEG